MFSRRIFAVVFVLCLGIIFFMAGCIFTPLTPTTYTITATAGEGGQIDPEGELAISEGGNQTFTITPDDGYQIANVLVDGVSVGTNPTYTFHNVQQDHTIDASFAAIPTYTLTMDEDPDVGGTSTDVTAAGPYTASTVVTIAAVANAGYAFVNWTSVPAVTFDNANAVDTTFTMPAQNVTVTANFEQTFELTMAVIGEGDTTPTVGTHTYPAGSVVDITAIPSSGCCSFTEWSDDVTGTVNPTTVSMNANKTVTANFEARIVYNLDTKVDYSSIQAAITAAGSGDTIIVCPGTYEENIVLNNKNITLQSRDPLDPTVVAATIIDGGGSGHVVEFSGGDTSTLEGFTITNGNAYNGGGIYIWGNSFPTISDNVITNNTANEAGGGIVLISLNGNATNYTTITGNTITSNTAGTYGGGIDLWASNNVTIDNNSITGNTSNAYGGGIIVAHGSSSTITGNTIHDNDAVESGGGIYVDLLSVLLPATSRPTGWGSVRENIPIGDPLVPAEVTEYTIAGNAFLGNLQGATPAYTEGAHVYFDVVGRSVSSTIFINR